LDACSNPIAHLLKVSHDVSETKGEMAWDVLKEAPFRSDFVDDPGNVWPKVAGVGFSLSETAEREGLAWIPGRDEMNLAAPRAAVEGSEIVPDRSRSQGRVCHPRHEGGRGETVSLDIAHGAISGLCQMQSEIQSSDTGAKAEAANFVMFVGGMKSHTLGPNRRDLVASEKGSRASRYGCACIVGTSTQRPRQSRPARP
jgi:hypothetical protein